MALSLWAADLVFLSRLWLIRVCNLLGSDHRSCLVFFFQRLMLLDPSFLHRFATISMGQSRLLHFFILFLSGQKPCLNRAVSDWSYLFVITSFGADRWLRNLIKWFIACYFLVLSLAFCADLLAHNGDLILLFSLPLILHKSSCAQSWVRRCFVRWGFEEILDCFGMYSYYYLPFATALWGEVSFEFGLSSREVTFGFSESLLKGDPWQSCWAHYAPFLTCGQVHSFSRLLHL